MAVNAVTRAGRSLNAYEIGLLPLPLFLVLAGLIAALALMHSLTSELTLMIAGLVVGGNFCAWLGGLVPALRRLGAPAIVAAFLPSYLVYRHWIPEGFTQTVTVFVHATNFIYLYIAAVVVGSIASMDRRLLLRGAAKLFVPLVVGSVAAVGLGSLAGLTLGLPLRQVLPMIVIPIMAGGFGEGAIPLSVGYAEILHQSSADLLAHLLPVVLFANLVAILCAGILSSIGRRWPALTGNGTLERSPAGLAKETKPKLAEPMITSQQCLAGLLFAICLYLAGLVLHRWIPLPAPVTMILLAVALKVAHMTPAWLDHAAAIVGRFFATTVTYPLLFAVAIALTPWTAVREALHPVSLLLITLVVLTLVVTGFLTARLLGMFPVEAALVNACHTGAGGTGDVAILTAAERLELMPFAQVATRIGGAITVTLALIALRWVVRGR
jgi:malate:Na+ symporter